MNDKKSLTRHWREKEEYANKWVALRVVKGVKHSSPFEMEPVAAADSQEELFEKLRQTGVRYVGTQENEAEVSFFYNPGPGVALQ